MRVDKQFVISCFHLLQELLKIHHQTCTGEERDYIWGGGKGGGGGEGHMMEVAEYLFIFTV